MTTATQQWLNSLTQGEASDLFDVFTQTTGTVVAEPQMLGTLFSSTPCVASMGIKDGGFWLEWASCEVVNLSLASGHPRWQPRITSGYSGNTPSSTTATGRLIKTALNPARWDALKTLVQPSGQAKVQIHHLALRRQNIVLPANLGNGASVNHFCDRSGCCKEGHLSLTMAHVQNLNRQRCTGMTLLVANILGGDLLILEQPCLHAVGVTVDERRATCCRKLHIVNLDPNGVQSILDAATTIVNLFTPPSATRPY